MIKKIIMTHLSFKPAQYYPGKDARVEYYYMCKDQWIRKRIRVNHITNEIERERYALALSKSLNEQLYSGWSPANEQSEGQTMRKALRFYLGNFLPEREDSIRTYKSTVSIFTDWCEKKSYIDKDCSLFSKKQALEFLADMNISRKLTARSYNNYLTLMRTVFNKLKEQQYVSENPFGGISKKKPKEKKRKVIPTPILRDIKSWANNYLPELVLPMKLIFYCGIRPAELCRLKVENVRFDLSLIYIEAHQAKDHESAPISLPTHVLHDLVKHVGNSRSDHYLFSSLNLKPGLKSCNSRLLAKKWNKIRKALMLDDSYQMYSLKDSGALALAKNVDSPIELKDQFRHSSLDTTSIYIRKAKPVANVNIMNMKEEW